MIKIKRALISVSDKAGIVEFARSLTQRGVEILSTGGTASLLKNNNIPVIEVAEYTQFPEMLDGRLKTLHPLVHGGILAVRDNPAHMQALKEHNIKPIDMVVVNLYPFEKVIKKKNIHLEEAIENIDIGGPAMLRAAAKNYKSVAVICNPNKYKEIEKELETNSGILPDTVLFNLSIETFGHCAKYDAVIHEFLSSRLKSSGFSNVPPKVSLSFSKVQDLRYGENPHQQAAFYKDETASVGLPAMKQLHGKELSFNNILDLNAALDFVVSFENPAAVVIKHNNPTGLAEDKLLASAYKKAWETDKLSAFGGIIGLNRAVDAKTAEFISKSGFMEAVIAPSFEKSTLKILTQKKNIRLLEIDFQNVGHEKFDFKKVAGGLLLQDKDQRTITAADLKTVTKLKPSKAEIGSILFGWKVIKNIKSNAVLLVKGTKTVGIGAGQTSRVDSAITAIRKAGKNAKGSILISEAFLPKIDTVQMAAKAKIKLIVQTGGSIEDNNVIKEANRLKVAMVFTGVRHFKH